MIETASESLDRLPAATRDLHRAILSLMEELEAIDSYGQRADASSDPPLSAVFLHNRNEEIEHASMLLEWIRRHDPHFDLTLRKYLFTGAELTEIEVSGKARDPRAIESLGIGATKGA